MAKATGLSHVTIARIWHAFGLQPHRSETFTLSPDPLLIDKVRDIVALYLNPPDHALVAVRGREIADSGARPHAAAAAYAARTSRAAYAHLSPAWH